MRVCRGSVRSVISKSFQRYSLFKEIQNFMLSCETGCYFLFINTLTSITTYYAKLFKIPERKNGSEISIHTTDRQKLFFKK